MVWPPSLSRDRKRPRPPIWRKTTRWVRVTPVAYKLEQSVIGQKMHFSDSYVILGCVDNFFIISTIFRKITQNSLFPYKTSIDSNSGTIKDRVVNLRIACGFQKWRIEWCDRHLCHVTGIDHMHRFGDNRRETAPWMRITPVTYMLKQSIMGQKIWRYE